MTIKEDPDGAPGNRGDEQHERDESLASSISGVELPHGGREVCISSQLPLVVVVTIS